MNSSSKRLVRNGLALAAVLSGIARPDARAQTRTYELQSLQGLRVQNVAADTATLNGKRGVRIQPRAEMDEPLVLIDGAEFSNGTIEAEIAGAPAPGAFETARGYVGVAFRVQPDLKTFDAFYLRPTNGRAADSTRRSHATQYISHPAWTWSRLRTEAPGKYEAYVDLEPGVWTKIRIEVSGARAQLFVHDQAQPTLVVDDVKSGPSARGGVALWVGAGTVAHFRNVSVRSAPNN
jgi:hypothetical protein